MTKNDDEQSAASIPIGVSGKIPSTRQTITIRGRHNIPLAHVELVTVIDAGMSEDGNYVLFYGCDARGHYYRTISPRHWSRCFLGHEVREARRVLGELGAR